MSDNENKKWDPKNLDCSVSEVLTGTVVVLQVLFVFYINLFRMADIPDVDMAKHMRHAIEIARQGIFIPNWEYLTYGELDNVCLFAAPLYKLTGNIYLSFGLVNVIGILFFIYIMRRIIKNLGGSRTALFMALIVSFMPTGLGMLGYLKCSFFGPGYYAFRFMVPLVLIAVLSTPREKALKVDNIVLIVIFELMALLTAISSSLFIFGISVVPVIICYVILHLKGSGKEQILEDTVLGISVVMTVIGLLINKSVGISSHVSGMIIRASSEGLVTDFRRALQNLINITAGGTSTEALFSREGLVYVAGVMITLVILISGIYGAHRAFFLKKIEGGVKEMSGEEKFRVILMSIFLWAFLVNVITDSTMRYQLPGFYPLLICAMLNLDKAIDGADTKKFSTFCYICFAGMVAFVTVLNGVALLTGYAHQYDYIRATCSRFIEEADRRGCKMVYIYDSYAFTEMLRLYDTERLYLTLDTGSEVPYPDAADFYYDVRENTEMPAYNMVIIAESGKSLTDILPGELGATYKHISTIDGYEIYESQTNPWDGLSGLPLAGKDRSVDNWTSPDYYVSGDGSIITGPFLAPYGSAYDVTVTVRGDAIPSVNDKTSSGVEAGEGLTAYTFRLEDMGSYRVTVTGIKDRSDLVSIEYDRVR